MSENSEIWVFHNQKRASFTNQGRWGVRAATGTLPFSPDRRRHGGALRQRPSAGRNSVHDQLDNADGFLLRRGAGSAGVKLEVAGWNENRQPCLWSGRKLDELAYPRRRFELELDVFVRPPHDGFDQLIDQRLPVAEDNLDWLPWLLRGWIESIAKNELNERPDLRLLRRSRSSHVQDADSVLANKPHKRLFRVILAVS